MTTKDDTQGRPVLTVLADSTDSSMTDLQKPTPTETPSPLPTSGETPLQDYGSTIHGSRNIACLPHMEGHRLWLLIAT